MLILRLGNFINQIFYLMSKIFYFVGISVIALVLGLAGCSDDMPKVQQTDNDAASMKGKSALDMALERADEFFRQIGATTRTPRRVATVNAIAGSTTRSEADTMLFLVNYADNQGFALLGADPAINDIYAISPSGSLTYEDINANPVVADFFYDVVSYVVNPPIITDSVGVEWKYWQYRNTAQSSASLLPGDVTDWHQEAPYNSYCKNSDGKVVTAGCVAVSVGMLLAFYEEPKGLDYSWSDTSIEKFDFDWNALLYSNNVSQRQSSVARMFSFLGNKKLLNTNYNNGSSSEVTDINPTIKNLGGGNCIFQGLSMSENIDTIACFLLDGRKTINFINKLVYKAAPLIVFGKYKPNKYDNHAWVIDGVITRERCRTDALGRPIGMTQPDGSLIYSKALPMWHCVWGTKDSVLNGWYVYLKDANKLDAVQYDPFPNKVNLEGVWPTGVKMPKVYEDWRVFGGCFPNTVKVSVSIK